MPPQSSNEIRYTTTDGSVLTVNESGKLLDGTTINYFKDSDGNKLSIESNSYENGVGVIKFSDKIAFIDGYYDQDVITCYNAFNNKLQSIIIPPECKTIGFSAFDDCYSLVDITLSDSLSSIGQYAFRYCKFAKLEIPSNVTSIGDGFVDNCDNLINIIVKPINPPSVSAVLLSNSNAKVYVPDESVNAYKSDTGWSYVASKIKPMSEYSE